MKATVTLDALAAAVWNCKGSQLTPGGVTMTTKGWLYVDPSGHTVAADCYTGTELRGWPVRMPKGDERVTITAREDGNGVSIMADSWVMDRTGEQLTGRAGRAALALLDAAATVRE